MAGYERVVMREERVFHHLAAPIASKHYAIIEDCHGVLYNNNSTSVAADEYYDSWPQKVINASTRPPLPPPPHQGQHFPPHQQSQIMMQRPVNNVQRRKGTAILTSTEAAERYGGVVTTVFHPRKHGLPGQFNKD